MDPINYEVFRIRTAYVSTDGFELELKNRGWLSALSGGFRTGLSSTSRQNRVSVFYGGFTRVSSSPTTSAIANHTQVSALDAHSTCYTMLARADERASSTGRDLLQQSSRSY